MTITEANVNFHPDFGQAHTCEGINMIPVLPLLICRTAPAKQK
jgi:hypothetical protein